MSGNSRKRGDSRGGGFGSRKRKRGAAASVRERLREPKVLGSSPRRGTWTVRESGRPLLAKVSAATEGPFRARPPSRSVRNAPVAPSGNYYLWAFNHDHNDCHLFSAASPYGPWSYRGNWQGVGTARPQRRRPVTTRATSRLERSPGIPRRASSTAFHSARGTGANYNRWQETFILRSRPPTSSIAASTSWRTRQ